jgi:hypothetical protein
MAVDRFASFFFISGNNRNLKLFIYEQQVMPMCFKNFEHGDKIL